MIFSMSCGSMGGYASLINHWLSPEPKGEGTCNYIYLVGMFPYALCWITVDYREKR